MMNPEGQPWCARSDPRMNRAVEARLQNPSLSLYECLRMGGFEYASDEANSLDDENVTLAQRKNQLNRRLRSYRHRLSKAKARANRGAQAAAPASVGSASEESKRAPGDEIPNREVSTLLIPGLISDWDAFGVVDEHHVMTDLKESAFPLSQSVSDVHNQALIDALYGSLAQSSLFEQGEDENSVATNTAFTTLFQGQAQPLSSLIDSLGLRSAEPMPAFSSNQPMLSLPSVGIPSADSNNSMQSIYASLPAALVSSTTRDEYHTFPGSASAAATTTTSANPLASLTLNQQTFSTRAASASGQAINVSTNSSGNAIDLESLLQLALQSASAPEQPQAPPQQEQPQTDSLHEIASMLLAHIAAAAGSSSSSSDPHSSTQFSEIELALRRILEQAMAPAPPPPRPPAVDPRQELALRLFEQEMITIYARCLRTAGYSPHEIESSSAPYLAFIRAASQQEYQRVQRQLENNTGSGDATRDNNFYKTG